MAKGKLLSQVLLRFESNPAAREELSAVVQTPDGYLWIGSDELLTIDRLSPTTPNELGEYAYGEHQQYAVGDYVDLPDSQSEIDIEGLDFEAGYLWLVGSHSTRRKGVKGKNAQKNIQRLLDIETDANRYVLARIPLVDGVPVKQDKATSRTAACLQKSSGKSAGKNVGANELIDVLMADEHVGPFLKMGLPSKDNGFDIEAIAAKGNRLFLGLRGPVLRGIAIILEIEVKATKVGTLKLKKLANGKRYRKHFVDLNGLGVRDLCFQGEDLLILAGPTMCMNGQSQLFKLKAPLSYQQDTLFPQSSDALTLVFSLAQQTDENAEGITLFATREAGSNQETLHQENLMVVYDSPMKARLKGKEAIFSDVFQLSTTS